MAKATVKNKTDAISPELLQLLEESGAIDQARLALFQRQLAEHRTGTVKDLMTAAQSGGWLDQLMELRVSEVFGAAPPSSTKTRARRRKGETRQRILDYLKKNPKSANRDISSALGISATASSPALQTLKKEKLVVVAEGKGKFSRWSLA